MAQPNSAKRRLRTLRTMASVLALVLARLACIIAFLIQTHPVHAADPHWGTYRPHALVSVRARTPHSPSFGFAWHSAHAPDVRHLAGDREDDIRSFSWRRHDGANFGEQIIDDVKLNIRFTTYFVRKGAGWALRFSGVPLDDAAPFQPVSAVFYAAAGTETKHSESTQSTKFNLRRRAGAVNIQANDPNLGKLRATVHPPSSGSVKFVGPPRTKSNTAASSDSSRAQLRTSADADQKLTGLDRFFSATVPGSPDRAWMIEAHLARAYSESSGGGDSGGSPIRLGDTGSDGAPLAFVQRVLRAPFSLDVTFGDFDVKSIDSEIVSLSATFDERFNRAFSLQSRGLADDEIEFAKVALANVLGGLGYWHGSSLAEDSSRKDGVVALPPVSLFTATPSRATFPRGFLWDEGFHQLIVQRWDAAISEQCMRSWLSVMQPDGWIPREQILGIEAQTRFPQHIRHLLVQKPDNANPPTLFLPLRVLAAELLRKQQNVSESQAESCPEDGGDGVCKSTIGNPEDEETIAARKYLTEATQKLGVYFEWVRNTQAGSIPDTFRWRGRSNELTVQNGGYPLTLASGIDDYPRGSEPGDNERHVDLQAWMAWAAGALAGMSRAAGLDNTHYRDLSKRYTDALFKHYSSENGEMLCDSSGGAPACHEGYVTLLPFALGLIPPDSDRVADALDAITDVERLRSEAGVRSLSRLDPLYRRGDDYWTGPVWQPFNMLVLTALRTRYSVEEGPYRARAAKVYEQLRADVLANALRVYKQTGYMWENYDPNTGDGRRGKQFTGWSALVLLMYADMYEGVVA